MDFLRGIHWWPVDSPHKWPLTRERFPFDDVIMGNFVSNQRNGVRVVNQRFETQKYMYW